LRTGHLAFNKSPDQVVKPEPADKNRPPDKEYYYTHILAPAEIPTSDHPKHPHKDFFQIPEGRTLDKAVTEGKKIGWNQKHPPQIIQWSGLDGT